MTADKINEILKAILEKESTTVEEEKALMEACNCVWIAKANKVTDVDSFMQMLLDNMIFDYDVEVKKTENETEFLIKTFKS